MESTDALKHRDINALVIRPSQCCELLSAFIPENTKGRPKRGRKRKPDHLHRRRVTRSTHGWTTRRKEYARMKQLWESDMMNAARLALDGDVRATVIPSMEKIADFWTPILTLP